MTNNTIHPIVVYVAGPFRGRSAWEIECNIREAEALSLECWRRGFPTICPHANTRFIHEALPDEAYLRGDLEILLRCDALLLTPRWMLSAGARAERKFAEENGIPVFETLAELEQWTRTNGWGAE